MLPKREAIVAVASEDDEAGRIVVHLDRPQTDPEEPEAEEADDDEAGKIIVRPDAPEEPERPEKPDDAGKIIVHMDPPEPEPEPERDDFMPAEDTDDSPQIFFPTGPTVPDAFDDDDEE